MPCAAPQRWSPNCFLGTAGPAPGGRSLWEEGGSCSRPCGWCRAESLRWRQRRRGGSLFFHLPYDGGGSALMRERMGHWLFSSSPGGQVSGIKLLILMQIFRKRRKFPSPSHRRPGDRLESPRQPTGTPSREALPEAGRPSTKPGSAHSSRRDERAPGTSGRARKVAPSTPLHRLPWDRGWGRSLHQPGCWACDRV